MLNPDELFPARSERSRAVDAFNAAMKRHRRTLRRLRYSALGFLVVGFVLAGVGLGQQPALGRPDNTASGVSLPGAALAGGLLVAIGLAMLVVSLVLGARWGSQGAPSSDYMATRARSVRERRLAYRLSRPSARGFKSAEQQVQARQEARRGNRAP